MTDFEKRVNEYMQCDKKTLAELLALKDLNTMIPIELEEPKTPLRDTLFPPYNPMPSTIPNTPDKIDQFPGHLWNPTIAPWGLPIVWYETNTQYIN